MAAKTTGGRVASAAPGTSPGRGHRMGGGDVARGRRRGLSGAVGSVMLVLAGCGGSSASTTADGGFSACLGTPALAYAPGLAVPSASGAYLVTIQSATTAEAGGAQVPTAAIGQATFTLAVTATGVRSDGGTPDADADAGADAPMGPAGPVPDGFAVTSTSVPWMPLHRHGASTEPTVTVVGGGVFTVAGIDFFMGGYWQVPLNLVPASGAGDAVVLPICIPTD